jgi:L-asparagine transporter-like permease
VAIAVIVGRRTGATASGCYRMPLYPIAPVFALAAVAAVAIADLADAKTGRPSLEANLAVMALFAAYYAFYLRRRGGWTLRGADGQEIGGPGVAPGLQG